MGREHVMTSKLALIVLETVLLTAGAAAFGQTAIQTPDPTIGELFRAVNLKIPAREEELGRDVYHRRWDFAAADKGNFTAFSSEVQELIVTSDGNLRLSMTPGEAVSDPKKPVELYSLEADPREWTDLGGEPDMPRQ